MTAAAGGASVGRLRTLGPRDTLRVLTAVIAPSLAQGVIVRRPRCLAPAARAASDARAMAVLRRLKAEYGPGPLRLRIPGRQFALVLSPAHAHRLLEGTPEPFAAATREKRAAPTHFQPHGVLVQHGPLRERRRALHEAALATGTPRHPCADQIERIVREEMAALLADRHREVDWDAFRRAWWRMARQVVLGPSAREDHDVTDTLDRLRAAANWAYLHPKRRRDRRRLAAAAGRYVRRAEPGSLAARLASVAGSAPDAAALDPAGQIPPWLFAFDAAGIATYRALALLSTHPAALAAARAQAADPERPTLRAAVLESVRLWPTTMLLLREGVGAVSWDGRRAPAGTTYVIVTSYLARDAELVPCADRFAPGAWLEGASLRDAPEEAWSVLPFSAGPAACPGRDLVLLVGAAALGALVDGHTPALQKPEQLRPDRPLPATLDHTALRLVMTPNQIPARNPAAGEGHAAGPATATRP